MLGQRKGESSEEVMRRARRGTIAAGYFKILPVFMFLIPGMIAAALSARPESGFVLDNPDTAFGSMVKFVLPAGVKVLLLLALFRHWWLHWQHSSTLALPCLLKTSTNRCSRTRAKQLMCW